jgi:hypothetical protein
VISSFGTWSLSLVRDYLPSHCYHLRCSTQSLSPPPPSPSPFHIWSLGKYKLRSHKDAVTGVVFVPSPSPSSGTSQPKYLVSSSKDTLLKVPCLIHAPLSCHPYSQVWDMSTQHCIQTVVGHRCEIWSIALAPLPLPDLPTGGETTLRNQDFLILSGSSDEMIRGYLIHSPDTDQTLSEELSDEMEVLQYVGSLPSQGGEKCAGLEFHSPSGLLLAISGLSSKNLEMFRLRSVAEVKKKLKRRAKRQREKKDDSGAEINAAVPAAVGTESNVSDEKPTLEDYFESVSNLKSPHKIKSLAFGSFPSSSPPLPHLSFLSSLGSADLWLTVMALTKCWRLPPATPLRSIASLSQLQANELLLSQPQPPSVSSLWRNSLCWRCMDTALMCAVCVFPPMACLSPQ